MSVHVASTVWRYSKATGAELLVLLSLADQADDDGKCWPSIPNIAKRCRVSERSVHRYLAALVELGELRKEERPGRASVYHVNPCQSDTPDNVSPLTAVSPTPANLSPTPATAVTQKHQEPSKNHQFPSGSELALATDAASDLDASEDEGTARTLLAEWIEGCGQRPPGRVIGHIGKEVAAMLNEGIPYDDVRRGLASWQSKGLHPATLASEVHATRTAVPRDRRQVEADSQFTRMFARAAQKDAAQQKAIGQ